MHPSMSFVIPPGLAMTAVQHFYAILFDVLSLCPRKAYLVPALTETRNVGQLARGSYFRNFEKLRTDFGTHYQKSQALCIIMTKILNNFYFI